MGYKLRPQLDRNLRAARRWTIKQAEDTVDLEVRRQQLSDQIQLGIALCGDIDVGYNEPAPAGRFGNTGKPLAT